MANKPYRIYRLKRLALLLGAIAVSTVFAFGQRIPYMAKIADGVYIDVAEVSIEAWLEYDWDISNRYGAGSPQRQALSAVQVPVRVPKPVLPALQFPV